MMKKASAETFDEMVKTIEPFLMNEAGVTMRKKTLTKLSAHAKIFGKTLPVDYTLDAAAATKKRAKQAAFIAMKEEQRIAAEARAAGTQNDRILTYIYYDVVPVSVLSFFHNLLHSLTMHFDGFCCQSRCCRIGCR
jgi:hypothetical protein